MTNINIYGIKVDMSTTKNALSRSEMMNIETAKMIIRNWAEVVDGDAPEIYSEVIAILDATSDTDPETFIFHEFVNRKAPEAYAIYRDARNAREIAEVEGAIIQTIEKVVNGR